MRKSFWGRSGDHGFKHVITADFLSWDAKGMKFDLCLGNPPYQNGENLAKRWVLWHQFIIRGLQHLNCNGTMSMVTPLSWLSGGVIYDLMTTKDLQVVNTQIEKHFPGIGSSFSYFVLRNAGYQGKTQVNGYCIDLSQFRCLPVALTKAALSIQKKMFMSNDTFEFKRTTEYHTSNKREWQDDFGSVAVFHTNAQTIMSSKEHDNNKKLRVMVSLSGNVIPVYSESMGASQAVIWCEVPSKEAGKTLITIIKSRLFSWFLRSNKWSGWNSMDVFNLLPKLDLTRTWTDAELYSHFNLTEEEVRYIEGQVR